MGQAGQPETFKELVSGLGRRHVALGALPEHYGPVGQALLHALEHLLGDRFTTEVKTAWTTLYLDLAAAMTSGSSEAGPAQASPDQDEDPDPLHPHGPERHG